MKLVDFDTETMSELLERGYSHAVLKPIVQGNEKQEIDGLTAMEVIPFTDFAQASACLDKLQPSVQQQSLILEMTGMLSKLPTDEGNPVPLLIDVESTSLKETYHN